VGFRRRQSKPIQMKFGRYLHSSSRVPKFTLTAMKTWVQQSSKYWANSQYFIRFSPRIVDTSWTNQYDIWRRSTLSCQTLFPSANGVGVTGPNFTKFSHDIEASFALLMRTTRPWSCNRGRQCGAKRALPRISSWLCYILDQPVQFIPCSRHSLVVHVLGCGVSTVIQVLFDFDVVWWRARRSDDAIPVEDVVVPPRRGSTDAHVLPPSRTVHRQRRPTLARIRTYDCTINTPLKILRDVFFVQLLLRIMTPQNLTAYNSIS